jgi:DNA invertase Pin-like site-specific DNA recombinase
MMEGKRQKAARGGSAGGLAPYGFKKVGQGRAAMLVENPEEQKVLARMLDLRGQGKTIREITSQLNAENIRLRNGGLWRSSQTHRAIVMATKRMQDATQAG